MSSEDLATEALLEFLNACEAGIASAKMMIAKKKNVAEIREQSFINLLGWTQRSGEKLGAFEVTSRSSNNNSDGYSHAFNILRANNATINQRYHGEGFEFAYWLYEDNIYRQKLKEN